MIERFFLKDYLSFKEVELNINSGLVVFTGPSGSGKSILMNAILSSVGSGTCDASLCESSVTWDINADEIGIQSDDINVFKHIKKEKSRYFINNQSVSKKVMNNLASGYLRHLSLKDYSDFENENLLEILDLRIDSIENDIFSIKEKYIEIFTEHKVIKQELLTIEEEQRKIVELKEFAAFEIKKIEEINPKDGEDEDLLVIKKQLSKKEKVLENISAANGIFDFENNVFSTLDSLDIDSSFFSDSMNELRAIMETAEDRFSALDEVDIESVLNRIEALSELKRRYGSIQDALKYKEEKIIELQKYENIEITKGDLEDKELKLSKKAKDLASKLSKLRHNELKSFTKDLNKYLKELYLREAEVSIVDKEYDLSGKDEVGIKVNNTSLQNVSTGEFNRLRLAILALKSCFVTKNGGILMLDEIDANLSGEESMSVAKVLKQLSKYFQIFVISHQPQLTSMGDQHFFIYKDENNSLVRELNHEDRVNEIARIISGDSISDEAKKFAKELLDTEAKA